MQKYVLALLLAFPGFAQAFEIYFNSNDFVVDTVFSEVASFEFTIDVDGPLEAGLYENPPLVSVVYAVTGTLEPGTPSEFPAFELRRTITGEDFYAQGSSIRFDIADTADLSDGAQLDELVGTEVVFTFNGREIDNERFHPALLELRADGTGRIQNSNNTPTLEPLLEVDFGVEYITDLTFAPGAITFAQEPVSLEGDEACRTGGCEDDGGGSVPFMLIAILAALRLLRLRSR